MTEHRRGLVLSASTHGYAVAVSTLGATPLRVYGRHILPNIASALIANMILNFPGTVLMETSLSFLGLGIQPSPHEPRQHAGFWPRLSDHGVVDCRPSRYGDLLRDTGHGPPGRLGPGSPRSDFEMSDRITVRDPPATSA